MKSFNVSWRLSGSLALGALTLLVAGCLSRPAVLKVDARPIRNGSFQVVDQRPGDERATKWLSDVPYSCTFTVRQVGDGVLSPDRFILLTDSLGAKLRERLAGKTLVVTHFGIYINSSQRSRAAEIIHGEGLTQSLGDSAMGSRLEHLCRSEEIAEGWLDRDYGTATHSVVIVQITLVAEGRTHRARGFFLSDREISLDPRAPETAATISTAVEKASDQLGAQLLARPDAGSGASW